MSLGFTYGSIWFRFYIYLPNKREGRVVILQRLKERNGRGHGRNNIPREYSSTNFPSFSVMERDMLGNKLKKNKRNSSSAVHIIPFHQTEKLKKKKNREPLCLFILFYLPFTGPRIEEGHGLAAENSEPIQNI